MAYTVDTSKHNYVVLDMSGNPINLKKRCSAAAEAVNKRHAKDPRPSKNAPLAEQIAWEIDQMPDPIDIDKELQREYLKVIRNTLKLSSLECNA